MSYFKIVSLVHKDRRVSHVMLREKAEVTYIPGEWAEAPEWLSGQGYHLTVFPSMAALLDYMRADNEVTLQHKLYDEEVWECEAEEEMVVPPILDIFVVRGWYETVREGSSLLTYQDDTEWPTATKMFKRVKLTRKLF